MTYSEETLRGFSKRLFTTAGVPPEKASLWSDSLVAANLRGVDSHGVQLIPYYIAQIKAGNIDPAKDGTVLSESGACLLYDGQRAIGQWVSSICCAHAVRLALAHGLGLVIARNSNHFGAAAFWGQRISAAGLIGIVLCNASPSVPPWQGREGRIGTNPICVSVPSAGNGAWLLDMATTTVAMNKIIQAATKSQGEIPAGWAMDADGNPTTDVQKAARGLLLPLGGYKGSGLGLMVEILCGVLGGGAIATEVGGLHILTRPMSTTQFFLGIDPSRLLPAAEFQSRMEQLVQTMKSARTAPGYGEILVAGDPEWRSEAARRADGIPIDDAALRRLNALARELGVRELTMYD